MSKRTRKPARSSGAPAPKRGADSAPGSHGKCSIAGCDKPAVRSLSKSQYETYVSDAGLELKSARDRKVKPCDEHYKQLKKYKKKDDKIEKSRRDARTQQFAKGRRY